MAKGVLGNDPFLRGAAVRAKPPKAEAVPATTPVPEKPEPRTAQPASRGPSKKSITPPKRAPRKPKAPAPAPEPMEPPPAQVEQPVRPVPVSAAPVHSLVPRTLKTEPGLLRWSHAAGGFLRAAQTALGLSGAVHLDSYGKDPSLTEALHPLLSFFYERYWRVRTSGAAQLPSGPAVFVANHAGAIPVDGPILQQAIARERPDLGDPRWLVEDQVFHAPFLGVLFNRLGAVRACPENALRLLQERHPLLVFPEGLQGIQKPFRERYQLKRFGRGGFVKIALKAKVPIVPVAIAGSEETYPLLGKLPGRWLGLPYLPLMPLGPLPLPARWSIRFGAPIHGDGADPDDFGHVAKLAERTREEISDLLRQALIERKDPFRSAG